jgi:hypothetical protein
MARGDAIADRIRAFARPWEVAVFLWVPAIAIAYSYWYEFHSRRALQDFMIFRKAARLVLHGTSPFPAATIEAVRHFDQFVYPPAAAVLFTPLAELPVGLARVIMLVLGVVCVIVALRLLDVRDWRCYGVSVMSAPAVNSLALGAVTSFLLVGAALAWRYRSHAGAAGAAAAVTAVFKVLLWPLGLWLVVTRRLRAAVTFAVVALVVTIAAWAAIGFAGLREYPRLLHVLSQAEQGDSYSPVALLRLSGTASTVASVALVAAVALGVALAARGGDGDRRAFAFAVAGALLATPIVWLHYFLLLLVPIALYRPRLSGLWFLPVLLWLTPATHSHGSVWNIAFALAVTLVVLARTVFDERTQRFVPRRDSFSLRLGRRVARADT